MKHPVEAYPGEEGGFTQGRTIKYYAPASKNDLFGTITDYGANEPAYGTGSWTILFADGEVHYSEKKIADGDESYAAFQYTKEQIDWGDGAEETHILEKTYNKAIGDRISTESVKPFNGKGNSFTGYRFLAWNTKPDGSGQWYRQGQVIPEDVDALYAQYIKAMSLITDFSKLKDSVSAKILLNGENTQYPANIPNEVLTLAVRFLVSSGHGWIN